MLEIFIQIVFLLLFAFFFIFFAMQFYNMAFRGYAPFISTRKKVISEILKQINIGEDKNIYELGAGQAGFLRAARKKFPKAGLIGVEFQLLPYLIGKMQSALSGSKIKFIKSNIFNVNLGNAALVYCYLNRKTMARLEDKFKTECRPGTQIVSYQFPLPNAKPKKTLAIDKHNKIFIYQI